MCHTTSTLFTCPCIHTLSCVPEAQQRWGPPQGPHNNNQEPQQPPATKQRSTQQHPPEWLYQEEKEEVGRPPHLGDFQARGSGFSRRSLIWPFYHCKFKDKLVVIWVSIHAVRYLSMNLLFKIFFSSAKKENYIIVCVCQKIAKMNFDKYRSTGFSIFVSLFHISQIKIYCYLFSRKWSQ